MTAHEFTPAEDDWGFFQLAAHENIQSRRKELYPDGSLYIRVTFTVRCRVLKFYSILPAGLCCLTTNEWC